MLHRGRKPDSGSFRLPSLLVGALIGLSSPLFACESEQKSGVEKRGDKTKDALDMREHEEVKDAGEDAKDAVKDAADVVIDTTRR